MNTDIPVADNRATNTLVVHLTEFELVQIIRRELNAVLSGVSLQSQPPIPEPEPEPELLTRAQVKKMFGVSMPTLIRWAKEKTLPCLHLNRCVRYRVSDVKRVLRIKQGGIQ